MVKQHQKSYGPVVKAEDSWSRGCGFKPGTVYWMDVRDASYYIHKNNETNYYINKNNEN